MLSDKYSSEFLEILIETIDYDYYYDIFIKYWTAYLNALKENGNLESNEIYELGVVSLKSFYKEANIDREIWKLLLEKNYPNLGKYLYTGNHEL